MNDKQLQPSEARSLEQQAAEIQPPSPRIQTVALVCLVIGVLGFAVGLKLAPGRAWGAFLANFMFWTGLSMASSALSATFNIAHSWWGRSVQRITGALAAFTPLSLIGLAVLWFGRYVIFGWIEEPGRSPWLQIGPLFIRDAGILILASLLAGSSLYRSLRPDMGALKEQGKAPASGFAEWLTRGWAGSAEERRRTEKVLKTLAPVTILVYALGMAVLAIDLEMSINIGFRSTMFPVIYWIGQYFGAFCAAAVLMYAWGNLKPLDGVFSMSVVRDLGNMMWGSSIFWAYVNWSQYFVMWMGNLPREALYVAERWRTMPWEILCYTMLALSFLIPFFLLFARGLKRTPKGLAVNGALGLLGILLQRFLDVMPAMKTLGQSDFGVVEVAITLGFFGAVALPYLWLMRRVPAFPVADRLFLHSLHARGVEV